MSEEEKKAIEEVKNIIEEVTEDTKQEIPTYIFDRDIKCLPIVLNLIEKQDKEVIEKCEKIDSLERDIGEYILEKEKQDKMIDYMAEDLKKADEYISSEYNVTGYENYTIEEIKEEFRKKVEEDAKN